MSNNCLGGDCNQDDVRCLNCLYDYVKKEEPEFAHTLEMDYCSIQRSIGVRAARVSSTREVFVL